MITDGLTQALINQTGPTFFDQVGQSMIMMGINLIYSILCISVGIAAMRAAYLIFDRLTPFDTSKILEQNPIAVGLLYAGITIGVGICAGLIIGHASS